MCTGGIAIPTENGFGKVTIPLFGVRVAKENYKILIVRLIKFLLKKTPIKAKHLLENNGICVDNCQAKEILDFLYLLAE